MHVLGRGARGLAVGALAALLVVSGCTNDSSQPAAEPSAEPVPIDLLNAAFKATSEAKAVKVTTRLMPVGTKETYTQVSDTVLWDKETGDYSIDQEQRGCGGVASETLPYYRERGFADYVYVDSPRIKVGEKGKRWQARSTTTISQPSSFITARDLKQLAFLIEHIQSIIFNPKVALPERKLQYAVSFDTSTTNQIESGRFVGATEGDFRTDGRFLRFASIEVPTSPYGCNQAYKNHYEFEFSDFDAVVIPRPIAAETAFDGPPRADT